MIDTLLTQALSFGAIPGLDLVDVIIGLGIFAIIFVIFAESGLLIGFFLPGDSLLFTAGILYHAGILPGNVPISFLAFLLLLFAAAVLGEASGHWHDYGKQPRAGRKVGHATLREDNADELADALERVGVALDRQAQVAPVIARLHG